MNLPGDQHSYGIGAALKDARRRAGIDVKEAEERTKIRARYLRALEAEDWEVLPAPAYVRGYLRTYGAVVGIDGEALADEFRRRHEPDELGMANLSAEPIGRERRRGSGSRTPLILAIVAAIIILLVILATIGDDDNGGSAKDGAGAGKLRGDGRGGEPLGPVGLTLVPLEAVRVCLVGDGDKALVDDQMLAAGAEQSFDEIGRAHV